MDEGKHISMLVSIIINNYNYARFLPAAIESALAQSYAYTEVIVVDDGSTDESRDIISRYGDRIISVLKENGGQASAFNAGVARANGAVVMFLDADDMLLPDVVERVTAIFTSRPHTAKVQFPMRIIDGEGRPTGETKPAAHIPLPSGDLRHQVLHYPDDLSFLSTSGNAFSAAVLKQIFPMPEADYRILADYYLVHLTPLFGDVATLAKVGASYRVHGHNNHDAVGINLKQIRRVITFSQITHRYIKKYADRLCLAEAPHSSDDILSVSFVASRVVSLKLDPSQHPIASDTLPRLLWLSFTAVRRRDDVSLLMRALFLAWFVVTLLLPSACTRYFAKLFFFPERRHALNFALSKLHLNRKTWRQS